MSDTDLDLFLTLSVYWDERLVLFLIVMSPRHFKEKKGGKNRIKHQSCLK